MNTGPKWSMFWAVGVPVGALVGIAVFLLWLGFSAYFALYTPSTTMLGSHIVDPPSYDEKGIPTFKENDSITVYFKTTRFRSCSLDVGRYIKPVAPNKFVRGDNELLVQHVDQNFPADTPETIAAGGAVSHYNADLPGKIDDGLYYIFSRSRYNCAWNLYDKIAYHVLITDDVLFRIRN